MTLFLNTLALITVLGNVMLAVAVLTVFAHFVTKKKRVLVPKYIVAFMHQHGMLFAFLTALFSTLASLFLSEIAHFPPCKLCWYQRIAMYPQVLLLGIAVFQNDYSVKKYSVPLSVIGLLIALYHYILQVSPLPLPCSDEVANCALKQFTFFGYITIPVMSATGFTLLLLFMRLAKRN